MVYIGNMVYNICRFLSIIQEVTMQRKFSQIHPVGSMVQEFHPRTGALETATVINFTVAGRRETGIVVEFVDHATKITTPAAIGLNAAIVARRAGW